MTTTVIKEYTIPHEARAVFESRMISRKKRMSLLIEWFMGNWWHWEEIDIRPGEASSHSPINSLTSFAEGLTVALSEYSIEINRQRVWTWLSQRNLPRADNFNVMAKIATGWQLAFALLVLDILASEEPASPD